ncbi:hypothetical protein QP118_14585, partial [Enterococcus faecalis]
RNYHRAADVVGKRAHGFGGELRPTISHEDDRAARQWKLSKRSPASRGGSSSETSAGSGHTVEQGLLARVMGGVE